MSANGVGVSTPAVTGTKWVYLFSELDAAQEAAGGSWDDARGHLGGKGANLADMTRLGVPVPPGFTVTTEQCIAYQKTHELSADLKADVKEALAKVEKVMGKTFADFYQMGNHKANMQVALEVRARDFIQLFLDRMTKLSQGL